MVGTYFAGRAAAWEGSCVYIWARLSFDGGRDRIKEKFAVTASKRTELQAPPESPLAMLMGANASTTGRRIRLCGSNYYIPLDFCFPSYMVSPDLWITRRERSHPISWSECPSPQTPPPAFATCNIRTAETPGRQVSRTRRLVAPDSYVGREVLESTRWNETCDAVSLSTH